MATNVKDLLAANPYRNQSYNKTGWQKFLSALGFRTQADAWEENMSVQAAEYDAALLQKQHDTEYDDAQSQVARMRAAGLNPDLDPSAISAGDAAPMGEDPSTPMQSTGDEQQLMDIANGVMSAFTTALGVVGNIQGIAKRSIENQLGNLQGLGESSELFNNLKSSFISRYGENSDMSPAEHLDNAFQRARLFSRHIPKRFRSGFVDAAQAFFDSAPGDATAYGEWVKQFQSEKEYHGEKHTFYSPNPETMDKVYKFFGQLRELTISEKAIGDYRREQAATEEAVNDLVYQEGLDPELRASAENKTNEATSEVQDLRKQIRKPLNELIESLRSSDSLFDKIFGLGLNAWFLSHGF